MNGPTSRPSERALWALVAAIVVGTCAEHALFVASASVFPRDLNLAYRALPELYEQLGRGEGVAALTRLREPGGWYNAAIAAWLHLAGPSGPAFAMVSIPWVGLVVLATAGLARTWFGPWAAVAAAAWVAQVPGVTRVARGAWIHTPEAALTTLGAWAFARDPSLARVGTVVTLALTGGLTLALRPSGIVWVGLLGLAAVARWRPLPPLRAGLVVAAWLLGSLVPLPLLRTYLGGKMGVRAHYAAVVEGLPTELGHLVGVVPALIALVGIGLLLAVRPPATGGGPDARLRAVVVGGWLLAPLAILAVFRTGLDNFPLVFVAVALLAGRGLGGARPAWRSTGVGLAVAGWALGLASNVREDLTPPSAPNASHRVAALIDATCPTRTARQGCTVVVEQSLFYPRAEEPGWLELFLMDERALRLVPLHQRGLAARGVPAALATWECGAQDHLARGARPSRDADLRGLVTRGRLAPAWSVEADGCTFWWLTRDGRLDQPAALPGGGIVTPHGRPAWFADADGGR